MGRYALILAQLDLGPRPSLLVLGPPAHPLIPLCLSFYSGIIIQLFDDNTVV